MTEISKYTRHVRLVSGTLDRLGLDFLKLANINSKDVRLMVHRCEGCTVPEACEWMLAQNRVLEKPLKHCRNANEFARLKP